MSLYKNRDQYSDAPKFVVDTATGNTGQEKFGNTTGTGVFCVDDTENGLRSDVSHSGWVKRTLGTGPVTGLVINAGGTGYDNADTISISGGIVNATATLSTNSTGGITTVTLTSGGSGFTNAASATVAITTGGGTAANVTVSSLSGRAGREHIETLVALTSVTTDATDFANTSDANVANSTGTADDAVFPNV